MHSFSSAHRKGIIGAVLALALGLLAIALPSGAAASDRNHDKIPDRWEKRHGLSLKVNQAKRDQDADKLVNRLEWRAGMDPRDDDSDDDGVEDGDEGAGTVGSYDSETGLLTIDVFGDGQVTGLVTDETEISCDDGDDHGDEDGDGHGDHGDHEHGNPGPGGGDDDEGDDEDVPKSDDDPADDEGDTDDEDSDDERECSTADLVPGAIVQEAELEIEPGVGLVFEEIELLNR
ncbi:MAG: hypothetical protein ABI726_09145 [bacterium]